MEGIMNLTVGQLAGGFVGVLTLLSIFVEITPVKVNPVSSFLAWLGRKTSKDVTDKLDGLEERITELEETVSEAEAKDDRRDAVTCRVRILRFGDECRLGQLHSKEGFDQVLEDIDHYEKYCAAHPEFVNNKTVLTTQTIKDAYQKCIDENSFL